MRPPETIPKAPPGMLELAALAERMGYGRPEVERAAEEVSSSEEVRDDAAARLAAGVPRRTAAQKSLPGPGGDRVGRKEKESREDGSREKPGVILAARAAQAVEAEKERRRDQRGRRRESSSRSRSRGRSRRRRSRRRRRSSSQSGSSSSAEGACHRLARTAERRPGKLLRRTLRQVEDVLREERGEKEGALTPSFVRYFQLHASRQHYPTGAKRDFRTLAESLDAILAGKVAKAADLLCQRFFARELSAQMGGSWAASKHLELIPKDAASGDSDQVKRHAAKAELADLKLRGLLSKSHSGRG